MLQLFENIKIETIRLDRELKIGFRIAVAGDDLEKYLEFLVLVKARKLDVILGSIRGASILCALRGSRRYPCRKVKK